MKVVYYPLYNIYRLNEEYYIVVGYKIEYKNVYTYELHVYMSLRFFFQTKVSNPASNFRLLALISTIGSILRNTRQYTFHTTD